VDLSQRLALAGFERIYVPTATVVHEGAHSTRKNPSAMLRVHHESAYRYLAKRYRGWWNAPLRLVLHVALTIRSRIAR
jgi:N-acetylglucosaminyl-diphospho-decaprenol L-rhamnosyltransferase